MSTQLDLINRQIQQEKDRHNTVINDLDRKRNQENTLHQQKMRQLNSRKNQLKNIIESFFINRTKKKYTTLDKMYKILQKATADFI